MKNYTTKELRKKVYVFGELIEDKRILLTNDSNYDDYFKGSEEINLNKKPMAPVILGVLSVLSVGIYYLFAVISVLLDGTNGLKGLLKASQINILAQTLIILLTICGLCFMCYLVCTYYGKHKTGFKAFTLVSIIFSCLIKFILIVVNNGLDKNKSYIFLYVMLVVDMVALAFLYILYYIDSTVIVLKNNEILVDGNKPKFYGLLWFIVYCLSLLIFLFVALFLFGDSLFEWIDILMY